MIKKAKYHYRPIPVSNVLTVCERYIYERLDQCFIDSLSKYQSGFRQGYGTQNCLLAMIEKIRKFRDRKHHSCSTNRFIKSLWLNLLIANLIPYGFDKNAFFISSYLKIRKQKTRIGWEFSNHLNILFGVRQGSIIGLILFIFFLSDFFCIYNDLDYLR